MPTTRLVTVALTAVLLVACGDDPASDGASEDIEGLEVFEDLSNEHVEGDVDYDTDPPVGGEHHQVWLDCGFYGVPVPNENAVHSLEHGVVWLAHDPDLPEAGVERLRSVFESQPDRIVVSPYPGLDSPVVAVAWGRRLELDSADDARLEQFVDAFVNGAAAPEPAAACTGGLGSG